MLPGEVQPAGNATETGPSTTAPMLAAMSALDRHLGPYWQERAACGSDPESFFDPKRADEALAICARCPVRDACADYADANGEEFGVWGGTARGFLTGPAARRNRRTG